ncbi:MAG: SAM-dependent methyltransferase [Acidobacteria bacterium]|nr:MAG: SAM-dependent methyltransferase [Acidobacteriota bacterium]PYV72791.1 MAG: SAM-dependent methyltransferase [Acidobacteriota bacterium]
MSIFEGYSKYYDLLYGDKKYSAEAAFVLELVRRHRPNASCLLELGCGSGGHALLLAQSGINVCGVDRSPWMVEMARCKLETIPGDIRQRLTFLQGDLRHIRLEKRFDAVIALFHVMSYQVTNTDVADAFRVAREHLNPSGVFLFDCWYGPGVLSDPPAVRVKRWNDHVRRITRISEPVMHASQNVVDVNYTLVICDHDGNNLEELKETHRMRYFFVPELEMFASQAGLRIIESREWMAGKEPDFSSWNACFVAQQ